MKKFLIVFVSGVLMGLTPAPVYAWFLAWGAIVPLWILLIYNPQKPKSNHLDFNKKIPLKKTFY